MSRAGSAHPFPTDDSERAIREEFARQFDEFPELLTDYEIDTMWQEEQMALSVDPTRPADSQLIDPLILRDMDDDAKEQARRAEARAGNTRYHAARQSA